MQSSRCPPPLSPPVRLPKDYRTFILDLVAKCLKHGQPRTLLVYAKPGITRYNQVMEMVFPLRATHDDGQGRDIQLFLAQPSSLCLRENTPRRRLCRLDRNSISVTFTVAHR